MTTVKKLHRQAMNFAHEATIARNAGDINQAIQLISTAFEHESLAASRVPEGEQAEPTRSILYRSAASLAFQAEHYDQAMRLIALGLSGYPPPKIKFDLLNLLDQVKFKTYLNETAQELTDEGLLIVMRGSAVDVGRILYKEFKKRYDNTIALIDKTTQRLTDRPYKRGKDGAAFTYQKVIEVPAMQSSFAISLQLLAPSTPSFLLPPPVEVINEVVYGVELAENGQESELRSHINNNQYYTHFVNIVRAMAPDGNNVDHIGFVTTQRNASLSKTKNELPSISVAEIESVAPQKPRKQIEQTGRLAFADDLMKGENAVGIDVGDGKSMKIKLTEGIDDLVTQYWNKIVTVTGVFDGDYIYATDITSNED